MIKRSRAVGFIVFALSGSAGADQSIINGITDNVMKVCDKPEDAGKYWDMKIKGNGEAELKLKLADLGLTGEAEFSKGEWEGIRTTVENNRDYRDCVKTLAPLFLEKFTPILEAKDENQDANTRVLGGVRWVEFGLGLEMTLESCIRESNSVSCIFNANAVDYDLNSRIYGSSAIYDQSGRKYTSDFVSIANFHGALKKSNSYLEGELIRKVNTRVELRFSDVDNTAKTISKAMIKTYIKGKGLSGNHEFDFRNIKIRI